MQQRGVLGRSKTTVLSSESLLTLTLCQHAEHAAIHRDFVFWLQPQNGFCLMVNPSADLLFSGREGAASLLVCMNASTFTILQITTVSLCFLTPCEAFQSTLKDCQVLHLRMVVTLSHTWSETLHMQTVAVSNTGVVQWGGPACESYTALSYLNITEAF